VTFLKQAGGVLVVCRVRRTRRAAARELRRDLENVRANFLGLVVNCGRSTPRERSLEASAPAPIELSPTPAAKPRRRKQTGARPARARAKPNA
jgi:hypothetical protein